MTELKPDEIKRAAKYFLMEKEIMWSDFLDEKMQVDILATFYLYMKNYHKDIDKQT